MGGVAVVTSGGGERVTGEAGYFEAWRRADLMSSSTERSLRDDSLRTFRIACSAAARVWPSDMRATIASDRSFSCLLIGTNEVSAVSMFESLSRSSMIMRSAVFLPIPEIEVSAVRFP